MARRLLLGGLLLFASLGGIVLWTPDWLNPGRLLEGHRKLDRDCFSCHTPFLGPRAAQCIVCHETAKIGAGPSRKTMFHQQLTEQDCIACHTDHKGRAAKASIRTFSHDLLSAEAGACHECHAPAKDRLHAKLIDNCDACHGTTAWKPASFDHKGVTGCLGCHRAPKDRLHGQSTDNCDACHGTKAWKPATLDHNRYFRFDRDHPEEACASCHPGGDYRRYDCYQCHEHSPGNVRREHLEEGINDYERCVVCHRSGDEDEAEWVWKNLRRRGMGEDYKGPIFPYRESGEGRRYLDDDDDDDDD